MILCIGATNIYVKLKNTGTERAQLFMQVRRGLIATCVSVKADSWEKLEHTTKSNAENRLIVVHAGNQDGFIPGASLVF